MKRWLSVLFVTAAVGAAGCATTSTSQHYTSGPTSGGVVAHARAQDPAARIDTPTRVEGLNVGGDRNQGIPTPEPATPSRDLAGPTPQIPIPGRWGSPAF